MGGRRCRKKDDVETPETLFALWSAEKGNRQKRDIQQNIKTNWRKVKLLLCTRSVQKLSRHVI